MIPDARLKVEQYQVNQPFEAFNRNDFGVLNFNSFQLLPNQFAYLVDCTCSEIIEVRGEVGRLLAVDSKHLSLEHIYNLLHPSIASDFFHDVSDGFKVITENPQRAIPLRNGLSHFNTLKKVGGSYQTFHRSAYVLEGDKQGVFKKTISVLTLVHEGVMKNTNPKMSGPEGRFFRAAYLQPFLNVLSDRELEVLKLIAEGHKSCMIGEKLFISRLTVETHRRNMLARLEAKSTPHLVAMAKDMGLI